MNAPSLGITVIINKSNYLSTLLADWNTVYQCQSSGGGEAFTFSLFYVSATGNLLCDVAYGLAPQFQNRWISSCAGHQRAARTSGIYICDRKQILAVTQNLPVSCAVGGGEEWHQYFNLGCWSSVPTVLRSLQCVTVASPSPWCVQLFLLSQKQKILETWPCWFMQCPAWTQHPRAHFGNPPLCHSQESQARKSIHPLRTVKYRGLPQRCYLSESVPRVGWDPLTRWVSERTDHSVREIMKACSALQSDKDKGLGKCRAWILFPFSHTLITCCSESCASSSTPPQHVISLLV